MADLIEPTIAIAGDRTGTDAAVASVTAAQAQGMLLGTSRNELFVEDRIWPGRSGITPDGLWQQRALDVAAACLLLLLFWPVLLAAPLLIAVSSPGPIVYRHPRLGRGGKVFYCCKFRTMCCNADQLLRKMLRESPELQAEWQANQKLRCDPRITGIGHFLRRYSLDELPQLYNVLKGDMSLVGPRPLATDEAHHYAEAFDLCFSVRPGITGLWQVSGRNDVSYRQRVELDCHYARTRTIGGDLRIMARTIPVVLGGTGC